VGHAAIVVAERKALLRRTESLVREFHPVLPAEAVIRAVTCCRAELLRAADWPAPPRPGCASSSAGAPRASTGLREPRLPSGRDRPR
jgi:hypothetical protein